MSLLQDSNIDESKNKKILVGGGIALIVLIFIIVALLAIVSTLGNSKVSLIVNNKKYDAKNYLISKNVDGNNVTYVSVKDLTTILAGGYKYGSGNKDVEDDNQCYVTNSTVQETTFFKVGSKSYYKVLDETNEVEYYDLDYEIIKENEKIYIPIDSCEIALNTQISFAKNQYNIISIDNLINYYGQSSSKTFVQDSSIVWDTSSANKKLLKYGLVIIKDSNGQLGVGTISSSYNKKSKVTSITTTELVTPKHTDIQYMEQYNQLVVENKEGKGIVQLKNENGNISKETIISPQYANITPINDELYLVSRSNNTSEDSSSSSNTKTNVKYGIVDRQNNTILNCEYQQIGLDISKYTNNGLNNKYVIYDKLIPVKKDNLWGFVNTNGSVVIDLKFTNIGCAESNSSSNVLIIPEINGIVVKKDNNYGIISNTGKVIIRNVLTRVYKEQENNKDNYYMIYNGVNRNILDFVESINKTDKSNDLNEESNTGNTEKTEKTGSTNENTEKSEETKSTTDNTEQNKGEQSDN